MSFSISMVCGGRLGNVIAGVEFGMACIVNVLPTIDCREIVYNGGSGARTGGLEKSSTPVLKLCSGSPNTWMISKFFKPN